MGGEDAVRYAILIGFVAATLSAPICAAQTITVGTTNSTSDAPIFIADRKGYFRAEGLDVRVMAFRSASDICSASARLKPAPVQRRLDSTTRSRAASESRSWPIRHRRHPDMAGPRSWSVAIMWRAGATATSRTSGACGSP
jgi:hypothetical protein